MYEKVEIESDKKWRCPLCKLEFDKPIYGANGNEWWVPCCPECEETHIEHIDKKEKQCQTDQS